MLVEQTEFVVAPHTFVLNTTLPFVSLALLLIPLPSLDLRLGAHVHVPFATGEDGVFGRGRCGLRPDWLRGLTMVAATGARLPLRAAELDRARRMGAGVEDRRGKPPRGTFSVPLGFGLEVRLSIEVTRAGHPPAVLLHDMHRLVSDQLAALSKIGAILAASKEDVGTGRGRVRTGGHGSVRVDSDAQQRMLKRSLESAP